MRKLVLLLVVACVQFSSQENLGEVKPELISDQIPLPEKEVEALDGADKNQWSPNKENKKYDEGEWTKDDEKWLEEIQALMKESDEDYDEETEGIEKLIKEIETYFLKNNAKYGYYYWLYQLAKWFGEVDEDYISKEENLNVTVNGKDDLDLYYSWLYKKDDAKKAQPLKRFSSV